MPKNKSKEFKLWSTQPNLWSAQPLTYGCPLLKAENKNIGSLATPVSTTVIWCPKLQSRCAQIVEIATNHQIWYNKNLRIW